MRFGVPAIFMLSLALTAGAIASVNCPADVAPSIENTPIGNGVVNIDDLLTVINDFGSQGPPRPLGDIEPPDGGNSIVNIDDVLGVINAFGACPPIPGETCDAAAVVAVIGPSITVPFDTADSTTDGEMTACGMIHRDQWFSYTAPCGDAALPARLTVGLCDSAFDTRLAIYDGCDGAVLGCSDDGCGLQSQVTIDVTTGQTVLIRVGSVDPVIGGRGMLSVDCVPRDNSVCVDAQIITVDAQPIMANNADAPVSVDAPDCRGSALMPSDGGRWFALPPPHAPGVELTATTCFDAGALGFTFYPTSVNVYCGSCTGLQCVGDTAGDAGCAFGPLATFSWCPVPDATYLILVHGEDVDPEAEHFTLSVTTGDPCSTPAQCGADGDFCANAIAVTDGVYMFDSTGNTTTLPPDVGTCKFPDPQLEDIWFAYTAICDTTVTIDTCGSAFDATVTAFASCLDISPENQLACSDNDAPGCPGGQQGEITFDVTSGETYYIAVSGWLGGGPGGLTIACDNPPGACCVDGMCVATESQPDCYARDPLAVWHEGDACEAGTVDCDTGCADPIVTSGVTNLDTAFRPPNWSTHALADDFELLQPASIRAVHLEFLDLTTPIGMESAVTHITLRIYDITAGSLDAIDFASDPAAVERSFVVGLNGVRSLTGRTLLGGDIEAFDLDLTKAGGAAMLPTGRYALAVSLDDFTDEAYFWATAAETAGSHEHAVVLYPDPPGIAPTLTNRPDYVFCLTE